MLAVKFATSINNMAIREKTLPSHVKHIMQEIYIYIERERERGRGLRRNTAAHAHKRIPQEVQINWSSGASNSHITLPLVETNILLIKQPTNHIYANTMHKFSNHIIHTTHLVGIRNFNITSLWSFYCNKCLIL